MCHAIWDILRPNFNIRLLTPLHVLPPHISSTFRLDVSSLCQKRKFGVDDYLCEIAAFEAMSSLSSNILFVSMEGVALCYTRRRFFASEHISEYFRHVSPLKITFAKVYKRFDLESHYSFLWKSLSIIIKSNSASCKGCRAALARHAVAFVYLKCKRRDLEFAKIFKTTLYAWQATYLSAFLIKTHSLKALLMSFGGDVDIMHIFRAFA